MANKMKIQNIRSESGCFTITAIVIAKSEWRTFESKTAPGEIKGVMNITVRDTERDTAVVTVWGNEAHLLQLDAEVDVGTIVNVTDPKVKMSRPQNQSYVPEVSCPFSLEIIVNVQGVITASKSPGYNTDPLYRLLKLPKKSSMGGFLSLNDANQCGLRSMNECDQSVDLLVAIRTIRPVREIFLTKTQTTKQYREVVVMDRSFGGISIKFWGAANIRRSDRWRRGTVLLLENIRVSFCKFSKSTFLAVTGRTVILEDPLVQEAEELRQLSLNVPVGEMDIRSSVSDAVTDVSTINTVMTTQQIFDKINNSNETGSFTALCYALISKYDLDGLNKIYRKICVHCRSYMRIFSDYCEKSECIDKFTAGTCSHLVDLIFDIEVGISDHTGTLMCRLTGKHAEALLRCTVEEFLAMSDEEKATLKWKHLLERCAIKLVVKRKSAELYKHMINIVDCVLADSDEVTERISMY